MEVEKVKIKNLISPEYNPRNISAEDKEKLKQSIKEFGYVEPIIVNKHNNHIVGGNQRFNVLKELSKELKIDTIDVVYIDEKDINREKALNIALNKIQGEFDFSKLSLIFNEMVIDGFDPIVTGFDESDINLLIDSFDDDFDEEDFTEEDYTSTEFSNEPKIVEQKGTFEIVEGDEYNFLDFVIKLNKKFVDNKVVITIYQDTMNVRFDAFEDETLLEDFIKLNEDKKDRFRSNGRFVV